LYHVRGQRTGYGIPAVNGQLFQKWLVSGGKAPSSVWVRPRSTCRILHRVSLRLDAS
jgi:hypothetical protein